MAAESSLHLLIQQALKDLRYGTIQLTVHEGKLVQIERIERIRLSSDKEQRSKLTGTTGGSYKTYGPIYPTEGEGSLKKELP